MAQLGAQWKRGLVGVVAVALMGCPGPTGPDGGTGGGSGGGTTSAGGGGGSSGGAGGGGGGSAGGSAGGGFVDFDVVAVRFNPDGGVDSTFGDAGVVRIDFGTGTGNDNRDVVWSIAKDGTDRLVLFGYGKAPGARTDNDRFVIRLTPNGALDTSFAGTGTYRVDVNGRSDFARHGTVQSDGKIMSAGYVAIPNGATADGGALSTNTPVLVRLDSTGAPDSTFGDGGLAGPFPPPFARTDGGSQGMIEAYSAVATMTGQYVTTGYGRVAPAGPVDMISLRVNGDGTLDTSWNSNLGYYLFDLIGDNDRGRNMAVLPDGRFAITGSAAVSTPNILDAYVLFLTAGGQLDTTFNAGMGYKLYNFTGADEAWWGAALSPNGMQLAACGYSAGGQNVNDDATLLLMPLMGGAPAEFAQKVPLSTSENDRFMACTWDGDGRVVAVGMLNVNGDARFAVARFTAQGALDTTFGGTGFVTFNASVGRSDELARAVVVQSDGKIVVAGVADH